MILSSALHIAPEPSPQARTQHGMPYPMACKHGGDSPMQQQTCTCTASVLHGTGTPSNICFEPSQATLVLCFFLGKRRVAQELRAHACPRPFHTDWGGSTAGLLSHRTQAQWLGTKTMLYTERMRRWWPCEVLWYVVPLQSQRKAVEGALQPPASGHLSGVGHHCFAMCLASIGW